MKLINNTILITGGSSGIGLALIKAFYVFGNKIIIVARDIEKLNEVRKQFLKVDIFELTLQNHLI